MDSSFKVSDDLLLFFLFVLILHKSIFPMTLLEVLFVEIKASSGIIAEFLGKVP